MCKLDHMTPSQAFYFASLAQRIKYNIALSYTGATLAKLDSL